MKRAKAFSIASAFFAVGGALFIIPSVEEKIEIACGITISEYHIQIVVFIGIALFIISAIFFVIGCKIHLLILDLLSNFRDKPEGYDSRYLKRTELKRVHEFCLYHFGNDIASINTMKRWRRKYPNLATIVTKNTFSKGGRKRTEEIKGYLDIIPLNNYGEDEIRNGNSILSLTDKHVSAGDRRTACVYIGGIIGINLIAKARAIEATRSITRLFEEKGVKRFYSRPISKDGLRLVKKYGFTKLDGSECELDMLAYLNTED